MRAIMWVGLVAALTVSVLIACVPGPVPASVGGLPIHNPFSDQPLDGVTVLHVCDKQGICCYWTHSFNSGISCVATKVIVQIYQEDPRREREDKSRSESGGEVQNRGLEARLLRDYR